MAELWEAHLRYLPAIYDLGKSTPDAGTQAVAKDMLRCVELIHERLPAMGFDLTEEEAQDLVRTMVVNLLEHCRKRLAGRT